MHKIGDALRLSATDLMRFMGCSHATALDLRYLETRDIEPAADTAEAELLQEMGDAHELGFLDRLRAEGRRVVEIGKETLSLEAAVAATADAMRQGADIIFQGAFLRQPWGGYSDFLERVERPSLLGGWSYEVVDTKLKRRPDPKHVLQLSLYSDLLAEIQGVAPARAHLELGSGERFTVNLADASAYARHARERLVAFLDERPATAPEPVKACDLCRWREHCAAEWDASDSLVLVAGISRSQRQKMVAAGIMTMTDLARHDSRIPHLAVETQRRLQVQARLQAARRAGGAPSFELREHVPGRGFDLLPPPAPGDVFYDIEGDPYYPGGLEYLHGVWFEDGGRWRFEAYWAHEPAAEAVAVERLLRWLADRMTRYPQARIYHYANYEIAALKRLTAQHRVGEAILDQLLRDHRFVDLFRVVSGALVASESSYSIKDLEAFYMEKRAAEVATAGASVVVYERWRKSGDPQLLEEIRAYNETDCRSTQLLRDWLLAKVRPGTLPWPGRDIDAPVALDAERIAAEEEALAALSARLEPVRHRLGGEVAQLLLDLAGFYQRADKPSWWAIFDKLAAESEELLDDLECLAFLEADGPNVVDKRSFERSYRFPVQETKLASSKIGGPCIKPAAMPDAVTLTALDMEACRVTLRRGQKKGELPDRLDLLPGKPLDKTVLKDGLAAARIAIIEERPASRALDDLLARRAPRIFDHAGGSLVDPAKDLVEETSRVIGAMQFTTLVVQGPPGTGKTYVSARSIVDLVRSGRRVAVSSNSHKAIENLLNAVAEHAAAEHLACSIVQRVSDDGGATRHPSIVAIGDNDDPRLSSAHVVGGTAFYLARCPAGSFDYLFVDEAGQVSLANILAMGHCASNLVLVGDPMQLPQPVQGVHPGASGQSVLDYLIDGHRVVPSERGIFLGVSRRMHPGVCGFVSEAVYEGQLRCDDKAAAQDLVDVTGQSIAGIRFEAVVHHGRSQSCPEEVARIRATIAELSGSTYRDRDGAERTISAADILVVAPYNAQVNALRAALPPEVRVGTVDKFQGQEAPVCLVSMTTSSADDLPRDIEFLFSLNRLNVAVSRAKVLAILFASPGLLAVPCGSLEDMARVNTLCLLEQRARRRQDLTPPSPMIVPEANRLVPLP